MRKGLPYTGGVRDLRIARTPINTGWKAPVETSTDITQHLGGAVQNASYKQGFGRPPVQNRPLLMMFASMWEKHPD